MNVRVSGNAPFDHESITVSSSAEALTEAKAELADEAMVSFEGGARYWLDGTDPTTTVGHLAADGDIVMLRGRSQVDGFRVIATGSDISIRVTYLK
jgi:hypothetical protein